LAFVKRDLLSLAQILEAHAIHVRDVEKDIVPGRGFDETEASWEASDENWSVAGRLSKSSRIQ
jgi:hypothetical protein